MSSSSQSQPSETTANSSIQPIETKFTKIAPKSKYHFHIKGVTEIEVCNGDKKTSNQFHVLLIDDPYRSFYLVYINQNEMCTISGKSSETNACLIAIGTDGTKHEIIVQSGDMFTVIALPGHIYCIRNEYDDFEDVEHFNLAVNQNCNTIINPMPGRQYNFTIEDEPVDGKNSIFKPSTIHVNCLHI